MGTAAGSALALALLVCGCVFAAAGRPGAQPAHANPGPAPDPGRVSRTPPRPSRSLRPGPDLLRLAAAHPARPQNPCSTTCSPRRLNDVGHGLRGDAAPARGRRLGQPEREADPRHGRRGAPAPMPGPRPSLRSSYRDLAHRLRAAGGGSRSAGSRVPSGAVAWRLTMQTAARFGMHPGSRLTLAAPSGPVTLFVTGIVRERDAGVDLLAAGHDLVRPALQQTTPRIAALLGRRGHRGPGPVQPRSERCSAASGSRCSSEFPLDYRRRERGPGARAVQGAEPRHRDHAHADRRARARRGPLTVTSPLLQDLALFLGTQAAVETVLQLLFVSLIVVGAAVILLAARMLVARRQGELTILRARGGSLWQVAGLMLRGAVVAAGPGVLIGAALAIAVVPGGGASRTAGRWPRSRSLAALAGPPLIAVWQHRRPAPARNPALITTAETRSTGRARPWRRPVDRGHGDRRVSGRPGRPARPGRSGRRFRVRHRPVPRHHADPGRHPGRRGHAAALSADHPRAAGAVSLAGAGATGFVALSRAARSTLTGALPAFALVLTLSLATFAGMVSQGISPRRDHRLLARHRSGCHDPGQAQGSGPVTPAAVTAIGAVRGVRHATEVWNTSWFTLVRPADLGDPRWTRPATPPWSPAPRSPPSRRPDRRRRAQPGAVPPAPSSRCWPRRPPLAILGTAADPARHAVRDGTAQGPGRGHRERNPRPASRAARSWSCRC